MPKEIAMEEITERISEDAKEITINAARVGEFSIQNKVLYDLCIATRMLLKKQKEGSKDV